MLEAIASIGAYTKAVALNEFLADQQTQDAVISKIAVIGEGARHVPASVEQRYAAVPWAKMRSMRNMLIHVYFGIDLATI